MTITFSCCEDSETVRFGEIENQFLPYETGDTVRYKNVETEQILEFVVLDKTSEIFEEGGNEGPYGFRGFCTQSDDSYEEKTIELASVSCSMEYSDSVYGSPVGIRFNIDNCHVSSYGTTTNNGEDLIYQNGTYVVEGTIYGPVYQLNNSNSRVLVTPEIGVLSFIDEMNNVEYVFVE
jgi:hypothetical protein